MHRVSREGMNQLMTLRVFSRARMSSPERARRRRLLVRYRLEAFFEVWGLAQHGLVKDRWVDAVYAAVVVDRLAAPFDLCVRAELMPLLFGVSFLETIHPGRRCVAGGDGAFEVAGRLYRVGAEHGTVWVARGVFKCGGGPSE